MRKRPNEANCDDHATIADKTLVLEND